MGSPYSQSYVAQIIDDKIQLMQQWADYVDNASITEKKGCIKFYKEKSIKQCLVFPSYFLINGYFF